ncbi:hypothetical protein Trydic_g7426 [Trypoxylus dichotomus]
MTSHIHASNSRVWTAVAFKTPSSFQEANNITCIIVEYSKSEMRRVIRFLYAEGANKSEIDSNVCLVKIVALNFVKLLKWLVFLRFVFLESCTT